MTTDEVYESLTDEQLDVLLTDQEMRGPGQRRLQKEKDRRAAAAKPTPESTPAESTPVSE